MAEAVPRQPVAAPPWDAPFEVEEGPRSARRRLRLLGKFLISVGVGVLLFVAWTLWGTGLYRRASRSGSARSWTPGSPPPRSRATAGPESGLRGASRPVQASRFFA